MTPITPENYPVIRDALTDHLRKQFPDISFDLPVEIPYAVDYEDAGPGTVEILIPIARPDNFIVQDYISSKKFYTFSQKLQKEYEWFSVRIEEIAPPLVQAALGDFVLIYQDFFSAKDEDSEVGIVSTIWKRGKQSFYGVRYFNFPDTSSFCEHSFDSIQMTADDYGGYHTGFLKVLTPSEALERLQRKAAADYKTARQSLKDSEKSAMDGLVQLIQILSTKQSPAKVQSLQIDVDDSSHWAIPTDMKMSERFEQ